MLKWFGFIIGVSLSWSAGTSCETASVIDSLQVLPVDNSIGDQWYRYTAERSDSIIVTTTFRATDLGSSIRRNSADTYIQVYRDCSDDLIIEDNDHPGAFGASLVQFEVNVGDTFYIRMNDTLTSDSYEVDVFYPRDIEYPITAPQSIDTGTVKALLNYQDAHYFQYILPANGILRARTDNGLRLSVDNFDEESLVGDDGETTTKIEFNLQGFQGDTVIVRAAWDGSPYRAGN